MPKSGGNFLDFAVRMPLKSLTSITLWVKILISPLGHNCQFYIIAMFKVTLNKRNKFKGIVWVTDIYPCPLVSQYRRVRFKDNRTFSCF